MVTYEQFLRACDGINMKSCGTTTQDGGKRISFPYDVTDDNRIISLSFFFPSGRIAISAACPLKWIPEVLSETIEKLNKKPSIYYYEIKNYTLVGLMFVDSYKAQDAQEILSLGAELAENIHIMIDKTGA